MKLKGLKAVVLSTILFPFVVASAVMLWLRAKDQITPPNRDMWE